MVKTVASEVGALPNQLRPAASRMQTQFQGIGIEADESMKMTETGLRVAADAAAAMDMSVEAANASLLSFVRGNTEAGDAIGVSTTQTEIGKYAADEYGMSWKDATEAERQMVRLNFAQRFAEQAGTVGMAAKESGEYTAVVGRLRQGWQDFLAVIGAPVLNVAVAIMDKLTGILVKAGEWAQIAGERFKGFWDSLFQGTGVINSLVTGLQNIWYELTQSFSGGNFSKIGSLAGEVIPYIITSIVAGLPKLIQTGAKMINKLSEGVGMSIPDMVQAGLDIIVNFISSFIESLPMIVETGMQLLTGLIDGIMTHLPTLITMVQGIIQTFLDTITTHLPRILQMGITVLMELINGVISFIPELLPMVIQILTTIIDGIIGNINMIVNAGILLLENLINGVVSILPQLIQTALTLINTVVGVIADNLPVIIGAGIRVLKSLIDGILDMLPSLIATALDLVMTVFDTIIDNLPTIISAGLDLLGALVSGIVNALPRLWRASNKLTSGVMDIITGFDWLGLGRDIISGIGSGIAGSAGALWNKAKGVLGGFESKVKGFFGIKSPSRLMRDTVGKYIPEGIGVGIEKGERSMLKSADHMNKKLANRVQAPNMDINGSVSRSSAQVGRTIRHELSNNQSVQPMTVNLNLGGHNFKAFVEDISNEQGKLTDLQMSF